MLMIRRSAGFVLISLLLAVGTAGLAPGAAASTANRVATSVTTQGMHAAGSPCTAPGVRACVDLSRQRAWLMKAGVVVHGPVVITSGREGYRTSRGGFHVTFKDRDHVSSVYHSPMPYSVFFHGGQAFHQGSLQVRSHGCIHLSHESAVRFFRYLNKGDLVIVHQ